MKSKKLEVIITRIATLNREELKQLSNEVEAEIQFRDIDSRMYFDKKEKKDVWCSYVDNGDTDILSCYQVSNRGMICTVLIANTQW